MSTKYIASNWRLPNQENSSKSDNYGLTFDGSSEKINCGDSNVLSFGDGSNDSPFSISLWFNLSTLATPSCLLCKQTSSSNGEYKIYISTAGKIYIELANNGGEANGARGIISNSTISINQWYNIIFTYDGTGGSSAYDGMNLYINNSLDSSTDWSYLSYTAMNNTTADFVIGDLITGSSNTYDFTGEMSELAVFDYSLSESQISTLYGSSSLGAASPMALKPHPVAFYPLGDNSSGGIDAGPTSILTQPNEAVEDASVFDFDGSTPDFINCGNNSVFDFTTQITISAWVKTTDQDSINNIVKKDDGASNRGWNLSWRGSTGGGSRLVFWNWSTDGTYNYLYTTGTPASNFADGNWHHIIATYDGTADANGAKIYLDGVLMSQGAVSRAGTGLKITTEPVEIGDGISANISNVQLWNTGLSASEVTTLYNSGVPLLTGTQPQEANLKAWYKLDQSANWEADTAGEWQIPDNRSAYPQSFNFRRISSAKNGRVNINNNFSFPNKISVSIWFNYPANASTNTQYIIAQDNGSSDRRWVLGFNTSNQLFAYIYNTDNSSNYFTGTTSVKDSKWHQVVLVYDGTSNANGIKIFLDGKLEAQATASGTGLHTSSALMTAIGNGSTSTQYGALFDCNLSNAQIWDTDLTHGVVSSIGDTAGGQIAELYNNGTPLTNAIATDNLKGWWKLNDNEIWDGTNWEVENQAYPAGFDSALSFNGSNDYIDVSTISLGTTQTLSWWIKRDSSSTQECPFGDTTSGLSDMLVYMNGLTLYYRVGSTSLAWTNALSTALTNQKWCNIILTRNGASAKLYLNGDFVSEQTLTGGDITAAVQIDRIGASSAGTPAFYINGKMSNIAIWNSDQSSEKDNIYNSGTPANSYTNTPVSWWKLDNTTTGIQDSAGSNDGTNNGATKANTFVSLEAATSSGMTEQNLVNNNVSVLNGDSSGMTSANLVLSDLTRAVPYGDGYSFNFSGTTDYLEIAQSSTLEPANVSVSIWFKGSAQAAINTYLVSKVANTGSKGYGLYTGNSTDKLVFFIYNGSTWVLTPLGGVVMDDNWHHAVATFDGTNLKLYVDGSSYASNTSASGITYNAGPLVIAAQTTVPALDFDGKLSNCAIFNQALTSTEVMKLYANGVPQDLSSFSPAPVSWWTLGSNSFFNGTNYICRDLIGSNDGTSANAGVDAIVGDAPRSEANGTGTNMDVPTNLEGSTKWSSNNSWSINMSETARVEDTP